MLASRLWNEQKLAYPIKGRRKGTYWLSYFRMDGGRLVDFNRACQLNDDVLRNLTLKVDPRLVDTLVAHALGKGGSTAAPEEAKDQQPEKALGGKSEEEAAPDAAAKPEDEPAKDDALEKSDQ
jgi:small subunit ribosomal protein S6